MLVDSGRMTTIQPYDLMTMPPYVRTGRLVLVAWRRTWYPDPMAKRSEQRANDKARKGRAVVMSYQIVGFDQEEVRQYIEQRQRTINETLPRREKAIMPKRSENKVIRLKSSIQIDWSESIDAMAQYAVDDIGHVTEYVYGEDFESPQGNTLPVRRKAASMLKKAINGLGYNGAGSFDTGEKASHVTTSVWAVVDRALTEAEKAQADADAANGDNDDDDEEA